MGRREAFAFVIALACLAHGASATPRAGTTVETVAQAAGTRPSHTIAADTGTITGTVIDAVTGTPLADVFVQVQDTALWTRTDASGRFTLADVQAGHRALFVSTVGYALARPEVDVARGVAQDITVRLAEGTGTYSEGVEVAARIAEPVQEAAPTLQSLGSAFLQDLRGVLADDPLRAVQALPGVATGDDFRSEFSVRGSDYWHVGLSVDGIDSPWLIHTVGRQEDTGSLAIINSDILERVSLASAAYPQRYGDTTGAWLDLAIREGARTRHHVRGAVSGTNASIVAEGPLGRAQRGSWLASLRQSYLHWLLQRIDEDGNTGFNFTDAQAKLVYDLTPRQQLQATLIGGRSDLDERHPDPGSNSVRDGLSGSALVALALRSTLGGAFLVTQRGSFVGQWFENRGAYSQELDEGTYRGFGYRADATWGASPQVQVDVGGQIDYRNAAEESRRYRIPRPGAPIEIATRQSFTGRTWGEAAYGHIQWRGPRDLVVSPGARITHNDLVNSTGVSPWVQASWPATRTLRLKAGAAAYSQFPFFAQVLGPSGNRLLDRERARQIDVTAEQALGTSTGVRVTLYDREERDMIRLEDAEPKYIDGKIVLPPRPPNYQNALEGAARGVEVALQRTNPNGLSGWVSYAYGRMRYTDTLTGEHFWGDFDQRHTFNTYLHYKLSHRTSVSGRYRAGSNFPLPGYYVERDGTYYLSDQLNAARLPFYSRFDLRANRTFNFTRRRLTLFVEVINVLNRTNYSTSDGSIRPKTGEAVGVTETLLPILPSAGLLIEF